MTTTPNTDAEAEADDILARGLAAAKQALAHADAMREAQRTQPARLSQARDEADEARGWSLIEDPWDTLITAIPAYSRDGRRTGGSLTLPSITAKELFGARLAFDMLDAGDDPDRLEDVKNRFFFELKGDTGLLFLVCMAALDTVANLVVPQLLEELETRASNYDVRVMLADARTKSWRGRVADLRGPHDNLDDLDGTRQ